MLGARRDQYRIKGRLLFLLWLFFGILIGCCRCCRVGGCAELARFLGDFFEGLGPSAGLVGCEGAVLNIDEPIGAFVLLADELLEDLAIAFLLGQEPSRVECPWVLLRLLL